MKVIIDTDPGHDDAMAIMLACMSPELDVLALTTVCGNSTIENTTRNARFIMEFLDKTDIPIFSGASKPLRKELVQATVHGTSGLQGIDPQNASNLTDDAVEQILNLITNEPDPITLITLGPLTNIAAAIQRAPSVMAKLERIVIMGGAINVPGNQTSTAEFNMFADPDAADIVLMSAIPKLIVPLDACNGVRLQLSDIEDIKDERTKHLLKTMLQPYIQNIALDTGINAAIMYDPAAVFALLRPDMCKIRQSRLRVDTTGIKRGTTTHSKNAKRGIADIVLSIDQTSFIKCLTNTINDFY